MSADGSAAYLDGQLGFNFHRRHIASPMSATGQKNIKRIANGLLLLIDYKARLSSYKKIFKVKHHYHLKIFYQKENLKQKPNIAELIKAGNKFVSCPLEMR